MQSQTAIPEECKISHQKEDINAKRTRRFFSVLLTLAMLLTLATVPLTGGWTWADDTTVMSAAGTQTFKANYTDTTGNYENATNVDVTVEVIDKTNVSASITFADGKLIYNGAGQAYETASISGITAGANPGWTYAYVPSGTGSLDASGKPQNAGTYTVTATYEDDDNYGTKSAVPEIKKAETK